MSNRPSFQFYPADWRKDAELQSCSMTARGLWHECLCVMHECEPYGELRVNGKPMSTGQLARLVGMGLSECKRALAEIEDAGVSSRTEDGALYSRRMVRDEALRNSRATGGELGAEHGIKGKEHGIKGGRPRKQTGDEKPPSNPPPSSSTSSSSSSSEVLNGHANDFQKFCSHYPRPSAGSEAQSAFLSACQRADPSIIVEAARLYAQSRQGEDPKFTAKAHNWLNHDGWIEFGAKAERLTPEQDAASRDKADRLLKRGKYAVTS